MQRLSPPEGCTQNSQLSVEAHSDPKVSTPSQRPLRVQGKTSRCGIGWGGPE